MLIDQVCLKQDSLSGLPEGVEQEVVLLAGRFDENKGIFLEDKAAKLPNDGSSEVKHRH